MAKNKKGFTLVEILVAMALVAVLVSVMASNMAKVRPDQKKALFIKAYTRTEVAVASMLNDAEMYPTVYDENGNLEEFGLCSTKEPLGLLGQTDPASGTGKFSYYFAKAVGGTYAAGNGANTVKTNDGITYSITEQNANSVTIDATAATITVSADIKGEDTELAQIKVTNNGNVSCNGNENNKCQEYMDDRYDLRIKEKAKAASDDSKE